MRLNGLSSVLFGLLHSDNRWKSSESAARALDLQVFKGHLVKSVSDWTRKYQGNSVILISISSKISVSKWPGVNKAPAPVPRVIVHVIRKDPPLSSAESEGETQKVKL
ncbi:hypothetical protein BJ165DRAFT_1400560 [Panaeolus papilionaceus]|nr:hypothetical protein BJ165DRAFT_1400560 [Panaeolus papilionaceus]